MFIIDIKTAFPWGHNGRAWASGYREGQQVELALDVAVAALSNAGQSFLLSGSSPSVAGNSHPLDTDEPLQCKDGDLYIFVRRIACLEILSGSD